MSSPRHRSAIASVAVAVGVSLLGLMPLDAAEAHPRSGSGARSAGDPWNDAGYQPRPGNWRPYVLAPEDRAVAPVSVSAVTVRGGSAQGAPEALLGGGARSLRLISTGDRTRSPLVTLDFGKEVGGKIRIRVTGASPTPPTLHVCFSESRQFAASSAQSNGGEDAVAPGCDTANIWNGYPGLPYTYDTDSHSIVVDPAELPSVLQDSRLRGGFRYATLFLDGAGWVDLGQVSLDFGAAPRQTDPADYRGWFLSSDDELNKIWYAGAYTVQMNTWNSDTAKNWPYGTGEADGAAAQVPGVAPGEEVIFDGAKRDRVVWQGDLAVQAPVTYLSTHDVRAVDNSLSSLASQQLPNGFVPAASLVGQHNQDEITTYGEYVTWFIRNHYEHWLYTGDTAYLNKWWTRLTRAADWLESVRAEDPQGLIAFGNVGSCGHYGYSDCGHETYVNALYKRNLDDMASLATALGDTAGAGVYAARATEVARAVNAQLWDPATGAYRLSREITDAYPQDANATAVLAGLADADRSRRAMDYLRRNSWSTYGALTVSPSTPNASINPSYEPLPSGFEVGARLSVSDPTGGQQREALDLMRTFWGYQLSQDPGGTFWEKADLAGEPGIKQFTSLAHGWASGPTVSLTTQVLGIEPTGAGFSGYAVTPRPGGLGWAQGSVPTPHGDITASWRTSARGFALRTSAPAGTVGRLALPTEGHRVSVQLDGRTIWNGSRAVGGAHVTADGTNIRVEGVLPGRHTLTSHDL